MDATPESSPEPPEGSQGPDRPAAVPSAAVWNGEVGKWEVSAKNERGERDGECLLYRDDGTLYSRSTVVGGVQDGPFFVYHRDGAVAREGRYVAGRYDGVVTAYASDAPEGEVLRKCCVPPGAARLIERWRAGDFLLEVFTDREGRALLSDGRFCPVRPDGLPELAQFDESRGGWSLRTRELDRFWDQAGALLEEIAYPTEGLRIVRRFDGAGTLLQEGGFGADDRAEGPFFRRFPDGEPSPYADPRIRQERGAYEAGQAVGRWAFLDAAGQIVRSVDRGSAFAEGDEARSPAFAAAAPGSGADAGWLVRARSLAADGQIRGALAAAARGAVASADRAAFERMRDEYVVALTPDREAQWGEALSQSTDASAARILDALVCGADAAASFRALASVLPGTGPAASELVEASLLLAPERRMTHLTRALLRFQRGDCAGGLADADLIAADAPDAADSLRQYAAIVFRGFDDGAAQETFAPDPELQSEPSETLEPPIEPQRSLDEIRHIAAVYATRLLRERAAVQTLIGDGAPPAWLPPALSSLLPAGAVALRHETIPCDDGETIELDEELTTDGAGVPSLLAAAHADWAALTWLSWAIGGRGGALPAAVAPPAELAPAMRTVVERTWRIKDRLASGSLISRSRGVPGFAWQGVDIDALPRHIAEMAAAEYVAVRAMFLWLVSPDSMSPFQDDIRDA